LRAEVDELAVILAGARRVIGTVPAHHIYGFLFTVLVPATLDLEFIDARAHAPAQLAQVLAPGDVVVGYPDFWRSFMRTVPRVPSAVTGVTSTGPCPAELARAVRAAGMARFIDMFGSSETAGIGWRDDADAPYELLPYWRRGAAEGELVRRESDGEQRAYAAPDRLIWSDERHFAPDGRIEGAVQVGGVNVYPERVAALLRSHPAVAGATVRLMRPEEGERLKAFIVPRSADADSDALVGMLWPWLEARLPPAERPKSIVVGESLPVTELGKSADWPIPGLSS
jgi:4-coumarate--CoA ligase